MLLCIHVYAVIQTFPVFKKVTYEYQRGYANLLNKREGHSIPSQRAPCSHVYESSSPITSARVGMSLFR